MKRFKRSLLVFFLVAFTFLFFSQVDIRFKKNGVFSQIACAVTEALKVYIDGKETDIVCQEKKDLYMLPISFPFKEGENKWEIIINYDAKEKKVEVVKRFHPLEELLPPRGEEPKLLCTSCNGSGKCQICWPVGSGYSDNQGSPPCTWCNGTGKCWYCGGKGGW